MARLCTCCARKGSYRSGDLLRIISGPETLGAYLNSARRSLCHTTAGL